MFQMQIKKQEKKHLVSKSKCDENFARYIPGSVKLGYLGMAYNIQTKGKATNQSCNDKYNLEFHLLLVVNDYTNVKSMHICYQIKISKNFEINQNIHADLITVKNFFVHSIKEINIQKYGDDIQILLRPILWKFINILTQH